MALNPLVSAIRSKLDRHELPTIVRVEHPKFATALFLHGCLMALDGVCSRHLGIEQLGPHIAGGIVDEY